MKRPRHTASRTENEYEPWLSFYDSPAWAAGRRRLPEPRQDRRDAARDTGFERSGFEQSRSFGTTSAAGRVGRAAWQLGRSRGGWVARQRAERVGRALQAEWPRRRCRVLGRVRPQQGGCTAPTRAGDRTGCVGDLVATDRAVARRAPGPAFTGTTHSR